MRRTGVTRVALAAVAIVGLAVTAVAWTHQKIVPATPASALDDATIVAIFDAANTQDIETGRLAAVRGSTAEVREFGAMLARDHEQVRSLGRALALKLGVTPTPPAENRSAAAHASVMKELGTLKGAAFDHAFLQHEVAFHRGVIAAVQATLLPAIQNAEVRKLVTDVAPAFQAHMLAAQHLDDKLQAGTRSR